MRLKTANGPRYCSDGVPGATLAPVAAENWRYVGSDETPVRDVQLSGENYLDVLDAGRAS